jgi:multiple sugar transport system substrate-binding protein
MWSATEAELAVWQDLADDVTTVHPNITVTLETVSFSDYWDKLQTQLASGTEADIVAMQALRMPAFAVRNALRPLQSFIDEDADFDAEDFFEVIQNGLSHQGEVYAFGYDLGPHILLYNIDLFDSKGVSYPSADEPMTWEQFRETAVALTDAEQGEYGFTLPPTFDPFVPWLWSSGGGYMNAEETECTLDSPESLEALNFLYSMVTEDQAITPLTDLANTNFHREAFNSGSVGMQQDGPWQFVNTRKEATFNWDIAPIPTGSTGSITTVNGSGFGISNTTEHPEAAWQALKVITSTESLEKVARAGRGYPARQSAVPAFVDPSLPPEHVAMVEQILTGEIARRS